MESGLGRGLGFPVLGAGAPDVHEMVDSSERSMEQRLGGRPRVPDDEKRRAVNVSLSREAIQQLNDWIAATGKSRSELLDSVIRTTALQPRWPEEISGVPAVPERLSDAELQAAAAIANQALLAWAPAGPPLRKADEIVSAMRAFYAAAVEAVRNNR
jgi:hypothetical protein